MFFRTYKNDAMSRRRHGDRIAGPALNGAGKALIEPFKGFVGWIALDPARSSCVSICMNEYISINQYYTYIDIEL